jgi:hypothetical protein
MEVVKLEEEVVYVFLFLKGDLEDLSLTYQAVVVSVVEVAEFFAAFSNF